MSDNFSTCFAFTLGVEAGFTDDASDPGNWTGGAIGAGQLKGTKWGISAAEYPLLDIANLTQDDAEAIYRKDYWPQFSGDQLPLAVALVVFDGAVNSGVLRSVIWVQKAVLGLKADGSLESISIAAIKAGNPTTIALDALAQRMVYLAGLKTWARFGLGWSRRVISLGAAVSSLAG